ncbi:MAG: tetratricopeptide repeat protein [Anaerolineae bacterium]|nr:tetratricopeptide repeat protein [Anaerolineae bacterium]
MLRNQSAWVPMLLLTLVLIALALVNPQFAVGLLAIVIVVGLPMIYMGYIYYLGEARTVRGDLRGAIRHYDRVLSLKLPMNKAAILIRRAALRNAVGDVDGAIADYTAAMDKLPTTDPALYGVRAALYLGKRDYQNALEDSDKLLQFQPRSEVGFANRAAARMFLGDTQGAIEDCAHGLEVENSPSGKALLYNNRGTAYRLQSDYADAMADYNVALSVALPEREKIMIHPAIMTNQGIVYYLQDDYENARIYFQEANTLNPGFYKAVAALAAARFKLGQVPEAQKLWMELLRAEPRYRDAPFLQRDLHLPMQIMADISDLIESLKM